MSRRVEVCADVAGVARFAAYTVSSLAPLRHVAAAGGSALEPVYEALAGEAVLSEATVWVADEQPGVAPADTTAAMVARTLGRAPRAPHAGGDPSESARVYEEDIVAVLGPVPAFDLVLLALGGDGRIAGLCPDAAAVEERERIAVAGADPTAGRTRITVTLPVLNRARHAIVVATGPDKAPAWARIQAGELLPAGRVLGATWILDASAARPPAAFRSRRSATEPVEGQEVLFEL